MFEEKSEATLKKGQITIETFICIGSKYIFINQCTYHQLQFYSGIHHKECIDHLEFQTWFL